MLFLIWLCVALKITMEKKMRKMFTILVTLMMTPLSLLADDHSEPTLAPVEVWTCNLNEGKTIEDVRNVSSMVSKVTAKEGIATAQWIFTPFTGDMDASSFMLMTGWPDFAAMGKGFDSFFVGNAGAEVLTEWAATATCERRNLLMVENTFNQMGG
tara:strand:+ start:81 stop:548 length:468 start_codon:yes stop_codon:yes gene_type:complete